MIGKIPLIFVLETIILPSMTSTEVLYALVSPNEEVCGFCTSVSGAGDIDGDDYDDVLVGAYFERPGTSPCNQLDASGAKCIK